MFLFNKSADKKAALYQEELLKTHYAEVENMYNKIRGWKHDYKNHIHVLKVHLENNDIIALEKHLDLLSEDLQTLDISIKTGNSMVDAILNSKISLAKSKEIQTTIDANIPVKLNISEVDLCVIIGNLFDNAIEASLNLEKDERLIRIYIDVKGNQFYISFTNFTKNKKQIKIGSLFTTTKGENHGFGLVRIDSIVKKLDGFITRNSEDGAFTTEILLPL